MIGQPDVEEEPTVGEQSVQSAADVVMHENDPAPLNNPASAPLVLMPAKAPLVSLQTQQPQQPHHASLKTSTELHEHRSHTPHLSKEHSPPTTAPASPRSSSPDPLLAEGNVMNATQAQREESLGTTVKRSSEKVNGGEESAIMASIKKLKAPRRASRPSVPRAVGNVKAPSYPSLPYWHTPPNSTLKPSPLSQIVSSSGGGQQEPQISQSAKSVPRPFHPPGPKSDDDDEDNNNDDSQANSALTNSTLRAPFVRPFENMYVTRLDDASTGLLYPGHSQPEPFARKNKRFGEMAVTSTMGSGMLRNASNDAASDTDSEDPLVKSRVGESDEVSEESPAYAFPVQTYPDYTMVSPIKAKHLTPTGAHGGTPLPTLLVPIRIDLELDDGRRIQDAFSWNVNESLISPDLFARLFCKDLNIPYVPYGTTIAAKINEQVGAFVGFLQEADFPLGEDTRTVVQLAVQSGSQLLIDRFEWDLTSHDVHGEQGDTGLSAMTTPEGVAATLCADLGLGGEFPALVAVAIREQIYAAKSMGAYTMTHAIEKGVRDDFFVGATAAAGANHAVEGVDGWCPYVHELDVEEEMTTLDYRRTHRRARRGMGVAAGKGGVQPFVPATFRPSDLRAGRARVSGSSLGNGSATTTTTSHQNVSSRWACEHCLCGKQQTRLTRPGPNGPHTLCNFCGMYFEMNLVLPEHRFMLFARQTRGHAVANPRATAPELTVH